MYSIFIDLFDYLTVYSRKNDLIEPMWGIELCTRGMSSSYFSLLSRFFSTLKPYLGQYQTYCALSFNERKLVLGLAHVMSVNPKKFQNSIVVLMFVRTL